MEGRIYKIYNNVSNLIYIGSTTQSLKKRFNKHLAKYNDHLLRGYGNDSVFMIFDKGADKCLITEIEKIKFNKIEELRAAERKHIEANRNICVNKNIPGRTHKEYKTMFDKIRVKCSCGSSPLKVNISHHIRSNKHIHKIKLMRKSAIMLLLAGIIYNYLSH